MADQGAINLFGQQASANNNEEATAPVESTDRGMFDFFKKNKEEDEHKIKPQEEELIASEFDHKAQVVTPEPEYRKEEEGKEEKKHESLLEKLHRSDSSSSSSSDEEGDDEEKKKRKKEKKEKKGLKDKIKEKLPGHHDDEDTNVPVEKCHDEKFNHHVEDHHEADDKKEGLLEKIKDKMPGQQNKVDEHDVAPAFAAATPVPTPEAEPEKKGFLEKIKEKIPGFSSKNGEEEKKDEKKESE